MLKSIIVEPQSNKLPIPGSWEGDGAGAGEAAADVDGDVLAAAEAGVVGVGDGEGEGVGESVDRDGETDAVFVVVGAVGDVAAADAAGVAAFDALERDDFGASFADGAAGGVEMVGEHEGECQKGGGEDE